MSDPQLVSTDPNYGAAPTLGVHPEARMSAAAPPAMIGGQPTGPAMPGDADAIDLRDLVSHPAETIAKIGASIKRDVTDPKTWMAVAAAYFGPKVFPMAGASIARAASRASAAASRGAAAIEPADIIGMIPRSVVKGAQIAQKVGAAMREPAPPEAVTPEPVAPTPSAEPLSGLERKMAIELKARGKTPEQITDTIDAARKIIKSTGLNKTTPNQRMLQEIMRSSEGEAEFARKYAEGKQ